MEKDFFCGFEPVFNGDSEILILGSFPGIKSRADNFYYAHPQNRFWKTLDSIFNYGKDIGLPHAGIPEKTTFLLKNKLALWDIVTKCRTDTSMDSDLKDIEIADLSIILNKAKIKRILCNGTKSFQLTLKHYPQYKDIIIHLPSTSPANTRFNVSVWEKALTK